MNNQIKSKKRVREQGEVFTNEREVKAMCDLIPKEIWEDITKTYLEPSCGTGNFLVEIYARKLKYCDDAKSGLKALNSIYGIDIMQDNVNESRERLFNMFIGNFPNANDFAKMFARNILNRNIICGDSLKIMKNLETLKSEDNTLSEHDIELIIEALDMLYNQSDTTEEEKQQITELKKMFKM